MYLCSSALICYIDSDFSLRHVSMDLSSVLAAVSFHGVPSVTETNIQVASPQGCTPDLAGPEPSGTFIHPGQHLHMRSYRLAFSVREFCRPLCRPEYDTDA